MLTNTVKTEIEQIATQEELKEYLRENAEAFYDLHNTAYTIFRDFMRLLQAPDTNGYITEPKDTGKKDAKKEIDGIMSVKEIVDTYPYGSLIPRTAKKQKNENDIRVLQSAMQRMIHQNWPDDTVISRMMNRDIDVSRKVLILLFFVTDGGSSEYGMWGDPYRDQDTVPDGYEEFYEEMSAADRFRDTCSRLNTMLHDCGFSLLDPRNEFDWMVMFCLCSEDSFEMDENMRQFITAVFTDPEE